MVGLLNYKLHPKPYTLNLRYEVYPHEATSRASQGPRKLGGNPDFRKQPPGIIESPMHFYQNFYHEAGTFRLSAIETESYGFFLNLKLETL